MNILIKFRGVIICLYLFAFPLLAEESVEKVDESVDGPQAVVFLSNHQRFHVFDLIIHASGPLNMFPQVGLGLQTNSHWPVFLGAKVGASGPVITAGWYYAQGVAFLNINIFRNYKFADYTFDTVYIGSHLTWRNQYFSTPVVSEYDANDSRYFNDFSSASLHEFNYAFHAGIEFGKFQFEIGYEIPVRNRYYFEGPKVDPKIIDAKNRATIDAGNNDARRTMMFLGKFSKIYYSFHVNFALI